MLKTQVRLNQIRKVEFNTGAQATLVAGKTRRQVWRPLHMSRDDFFRLLPKGRVVDGRFLHAIFDAIQ